MAASIIFLHANEVVNLRESHEVNLRDGQAYTFQNVGGATCLFRPMRTVGARTIVPGQSFGFRVLTDHWFCHTIESDETLFVWAEANDSVLIVDEA